MFKPKVPITDPNEYATKKLEEIKQYKLPHQHSPTELVRVVQESYMEMKSCLPYKYLKDKKVLDELKNLKYIIDRQYETTYSIDIIKEKKQLEEARTFFIVQFMELLEAFEKVNG